MAIFPEDELDNLNPDDDLFPDGDSIFAVPLVRMEGLADEMTAGMLIDPQFIPTMLDRIDLEGSAPIIVTAVADQGYIISIDLTDFILNSNPVVPAEPAQGDCSSLIASTQFVCQAIVDSCKVLGVDPNDANRFLFEDCDNNPFAITVYPNPTLVEDPPYVYTWTDPGTGDSVVLDLRPNTFVVEANGDHVWTNPVTGSVHTINAGNLGIDPTAISCITSENVQGAIAEICTALEAQRISMTPDGQGGLTLSNAVDSFKVLLACEGQRVTDMVPAGTKVFICTPNDGSYITDIDNILPTSDEIDCDLIVNTDVVPASSKILICTPNDGVRKTDLETLFNECNIEIEEGEGIDIDVQDGTGLCGGTKHYKISVDLCEFTIIDSLGVANSTAPYFAMCVDGANFKISLIELQLLLDAVAGGEKNFWTEGQGTSLVGLGTVGSPHHIDLALQDYTPIPYEETASIAQISFGNNGIMPAIRAGTNIVIDSDGTLHSLAVVGSVEWGNIIGDIVNQADLHDAFINVTGDSMEGDLGLNNVALILRDGGAADVGIIEAVETAAGEHWELRILGSSDGTISDVGLKLDGSYIDLAATSVSLGIPGAEIGSRVIATGIRPDGSAQLGFEPAPKPTYTENCINNTDFPIGAGAGPQAWVDVCNIVTSEDITDEVVVAYFQIYVHNPSSKSGKVEISSRVDAAVPSVIHSYDIPPFFTGTVSDTLTSFGNTTAGQTITFVVRANGDNVNFTLDAVGSIQAAGTKFVVLGASASGVTTFADLLDTPIGYVGQGLKKLIVGAGELGIEFVDDVGGGSGLEPYVDSIDLNEMFTNDTETFNVVGGNFDSLTTVELTGNTAPNIDSIVVHDDHNLTIVVTSDATIGVANLLIKNGASAGFGSVVGFNVRVAVAEFIYTAETTSPTESIQLPLASALATYNFNVDWGDGSSDVITSYNQAEATHPYATPGIHTIRIWGTCTRISFPHVAAAQKLKVRTIENLGATGLDYLASAFNGLGNMTSFTAGDCDTSNVPSFLQLFYNCSKMTVCDVTGMDTSSCTNMERMFMYCRDLISIDMSSFDCSQVTTMFYWHLGNYDLQSVILPVSPVNLNLNLMTQAFQDCSSLATISGWDTFDTGSVTDMSFLFQNTVIDGTQLIGMNTAGATNMQYFLSETGPNIGVGLPVLNTSNATNVSYFLSASDITEVKVLENWDFSSATSISSFFSSLTSLNKADISNFSFPVATSAANLFSSCKSTEITICPFPAATSMSAMFNQCINMNTVNFPVVATNNILTSMTSLFTACGSLLVVNNLENFDTGAVTTLQSAFINCVSLKTFDLSRFNTTALTSLKDTFNNCEALTNLIIGNGDLSAVTTLEGMLENSDALVNLDFSNKDLSSLTSMKDTFGKCTLLASVTFENTVLSALDTLSGTFASCKALPDIDLKLDTSNATLFDAMFTDCDGLTSITNLVGNLDFTNATSIKTLFLGCGGFVNLVWPAGVTFPNPVVVERMFENIPMVTSDLSEFDFSNVTDITSLMKSCTSMTTVTFPAVNPSVNLLEMTSLFEGCSNLVVTNNLSAFDTSATFSFARMFYNCTNINNVDIGSLVKLAATSMNNMFFGCDAITGLVTTGINTSNVTNMANMFQNCDGIITPSFLTAFNFSSTTSIAYMFSNCSNVTSLDYSNADFTSLTTIAGMAQTCSSLLSVNFTGITSVNALTTMSSAFWNCLVLTSCNIDEFAIGGCNNYGSVFTSCPWSDADYDAMLLSYSAQVPVSNEPFVCSNKYTEAAARLILTTTYNWTITDDGPV